MAEFNPPDSHWAADFDPRLLATFHNLNERIEKLEAETRDMQARDRHRDEKLARAVKDARHHAKGGKP